MLKVTPSAREQVAKYFEGRQLSAIRICANRGG
jgi:hypothetical protein